MVGLVGDEAEGSLWESAMDFPRSGGVAGFVQSSDGEAEQDEAAWPAVTLVFVLSGSMRLGTDSAGVRAAAVGLRSVPLRNRWSGPVECLEVKLSPLDMFALSGGRPMDELANNVVDLEDLLGSSKRRLHDQLVSCTGWVERSVLVRNLVHEARTIDRGSPEVRQAWSMLSESAGQVGVGELGSATGWSAKRLRARFRREVGVTPKQAARLIRFGAAHQRLSTGVAPSVVAAEGGFADQSHLHRDVVGFSGTTPGKLAVRRHGF